MFQLQREIFGILRWFCLCSVLSFSLHKPSWSKEREREKGTLVLDDGRRLWCLEGETLLKTERLETRASALMDEVEQGLGIIVFDRIQHTP